MNTISSVYYGWAFLIVCGGGSYYFAKRSINADRYERQAAETERRHRHNRQLAAASHSADATRLKANSGGDGTAEGGGGVGADAAEVPKSDFESGKPFRSKKGDRFS